MENHLQKRCQFPKCPWFQQFQALWTYLESILMKNIGKKLKLPQNRYLVT